MNTGNRSRKGLAGNRVSARFAYDCDTDLVVCLQAITVRKTRNARGHISLARSPWRDHDDRGCFLLPSTLQLGRAFSHRDYLNWVFAQPRASTESSASAFPAFGIHLSPGFHARISPVCISQPFIRVPIGQRFSPAPNFRSFFAPNPHDISRPFLTSDMPLIFERSVSDTSLLFLSCLESADSSASFPFCVPFSDTHSPPWSTCALTNLFLSPPLFLLVDRRSREVSLTVLLFLYPLASAAAFPFRGPLSRSKCPFCCSRVSQRFAPVSFLPVSTGSGGSFPFRAPLARSTITPCSPGMFLTSRSPSIAQLFERPALSRHLYSPPLLNLPHHDSRSFLLAQLHYISPCPFSLLRCTIPSALPRSSLDHNSQHTSPLGSLSPLPNIKYSLAENVETVAEPFD